MLTKEELKELNVFLFEDIKNTSYAISKTNLFYIDNGELFQKENLTKHNSRTIQSATDYIHRYETKYPAVSGTKELIHFIGWMLKEVAD